MKTVGNTGPVHVAYVILILSVEWIDFIHSLGHLAPPCLLQNYAMCPCVGVYTEARG